MLALRLATDASKDGCARALIGWYKHLKISYLSHLNTFVVGFLQLNLSMVIFTGALIATFIVSYIGRRHSARIESASLPDQKLNKWLVGLSAGATATSGFVVTASVGLGYTFGLQWLLMPLSWLLGDAVFWCVFPDRINMAGQAVHALTMTDVIVSGFKLGPRVWFKRVVGALILLCLAGYVSAQWLAGQKFLRGAFGFTGVTSMLLFAAVIVIYSSIGGFRGSVYADSMQAIIRIVGTFTAITVLGSVTIQNISQFRNNIAKAGPSFLSFFPSGGVWATTCFMSGFAAAALGFGLGQPQIVSRYLAGETPEETRSAWLIYNGFVQFTWLSMTLFGVVLRGVMPGIADPEMGLSLFFKAKTGSILCGAISADIFATIAATSNSLLVAMSQATVRDLMGVDGRKDHDRSLWFLTSMLGTITMLLTLSLHSSVLELALASVSLLGSGLAPAMLVRVLRMRHTEASLGCAVLTGCSVAILWRRVGLSAQMNEAGPGICSGLLMNYVISWLSLRQRGVPIQPDDALNSRQEEL